MPDNRFPQRIMIGGQSVLVSEWKSKGTTSDREGNLFEIWIPVLPLSMVSKETRLDIWRNVHIENLLDGEILPAIEADNTINVDLASFGWNLDDFLWDSTLYSVVNELGYKGITSDIIANQDVNDYLGNLTDLIIKGVNYDLDRVFNMANRIATDPTWAAQFRAMGGMGPVEAAPMPELKVPSEEEMLQIKADAAKEPKVYTVSEVKIQGITPNPQDIIEANSLEEARALGFDQWIPMGTIDWQQRELELQSLQRSKSQGYSVPYDEEQAARFLAMASLPGLGGAKAGWTTGLGEERAALNPPTPPKPPAPTTEDLEWEKLLKQAGRPERVVKL